VCPQSPVVGSELGDELLEGLCFPGIADLRGALPFCWQVGWALGCYSSPLPGRCSHRFRRDDSGNAWPCSHDILGWLFCRRSWRSGLRSTCPTRCNRSNGQVWQVVPLHEVGYVGGDWQSRRPQREFVSGCCYCYFLGEGWLVTSADLDFVGIPP
jgi:hypothetical protein